MLLLNKRLSIINTIKQKLQYLQFWIHDKILIDLLIKQRRTKHNKTQSRNSALTAFITWSRAIQSNGMLDLR